MRTIKLEARSGEVGNDVLFAAGRLAQIKKASPVKVPAAAEIATVQ